jgi:hypothetical protein
MIYPYSSVAKAIVSLQQKGFDNDFYLSKKTLRCIQSDVRVDDINNKIVEIHPVRINNKRKWVVAIELEDYLLKGILFVADLSYFRNSLNTSSKHS